jgi:hypothetical protein
MTVKELKAALRGIPDETPVIGLYDGNGEYVGISSARPHEEEDENGKYTIVVIHVMNHLD